MEDYGTQIDKDMIRDLLDQTPDIPANYATRTAMMSLLTAKNVQPIPYTYNAVYQLAGANNFLAAGALNVPVQITIQSDAPFLIINQTYDANTANAARTIGNYVVPNASVILQDTGSGMQMMDQAVPIPAIFGTGQEPFMLPQPKFLAAKTTLQVLVSNYDAAAGYNIRLSFNGVKLYSYN